MGKRPAATHTENPSTEDGSLETYRRDTGEPTSAAATSPEVVGVLAPTLPRSADASDIPSASGGPPSIPEVAIPPSARGEREIGHGGIGRVLVSFDPRLGREVAVKELLGGAQASSADRERFLREARVTGQLEHPSIVPVYELGLGPEGALRYSMKLVRWRTLGAAMRQAGGLSGRLALLDHFLDLCHAVAYAHRRGVVHRDLKPENVRVGEFGETVVLDWGLAKTRGAADPQGPDLARRVDHFTRPDQTLAGIAQGTPAYMSPEQAEGRIDAIDERSDVWGLGAVLFELLTGRPPFQGETVAEVLSAVRAAQVPPVRTLCPEAPAELAAVAEKALRRDPGQRYPSAAELAAEVNAYQQGLRVQAYSYSSWELLRRFVQRNRALSIGT